MHHDTINTARYDLGPQVSDQSPGGLTGVKNSEENHQIDTILVKDNKARTVSGSIV